MSPLQTHDEGDEVRMEDVDRAQLLKDADTLMVIVLEHIAPDDQEAMKRNHPLLWSIRQELMESSDREVQRFNAVLGLWLVAQYPEFIQGATCKLCERLAAGLPLDWLKALETTHT
jgi:hypothetical protein